MCFHRCRGTVPYFSAALQTEPRTMPSTAHALQVVTFLGACAVGHQLVVVMELIEVSQSASLVRFVFP